MVLVFWPDPHPLASCLPPYACCSCMQTAIRARVPDGVELGPMHHLWAGYVAGAMMVLATNPVWMIKTRMQLQDRKAKASGIRPYSGLIGVSQFLTCPTDSAHKLRHRLR